MIGDTDIIAIINTANQSYGVMHSAAEPYAVVRMALKSSVVRQTLSRHKTYRGAAIAAGHQKRIGLRN